MLFYFLILLLLLQGTLGQHYLLTFCIGWSGVSYVKEDTKGKQMRQFRAFEQLLLWLPLRFFGVTHLTSFWSTSGLFKCNRCLMSVHWSSSWGILHESCWHTFLTIILDFLHISSKCSFYTSWLTWLKHQIWLEDVYYQFRASRPANKKKLLLLLDITATDMS